MEKPIKYTEPELVEMLRNKSSSGFGYLYDEYNGALFGMIHRIVEDSGIAEDILQEVFIKIFKRIGTYDSTKSRLYSWMATIANNHSVDTLRSKDFRNNRQTGEIDLIIDDGSHSVSQKVDHIGLHMLSSDLKQKYREVINLHFYMGYTHEEISVILNLPLGTVKTRIRAALQQMRSLFEG